MDIDLIFKALANPTRRQILEWLKHPEQFLSEEQCGGFKRGVCAGNQAEKYGQWSYFSRNEALIQQYIDYLQNSL